MPFYRQQIRHLTLGIIGFLLGIKDSVLMFNYAFSVMVVTARSCLVNDKSLFVIA